MCDFPAWHNRTFGIRQFHLYAFDLSAMREVCAGNLSASIPRPLLLHLRLRLPVREFPRTGAESFFLIKFRQLE
jgi:hypothetical protein